MTSFSKTPESIFKNPGPFSKPVFFKNPMVETPALKKPGLLQKPRAFFKNPDLFQKPRSFIKNPGFQKHRLFYQNKTRVHTYNLLFNKCLK